MNSNAHSLSPYSLVERWSALRAENARLRIRDAAEQLGVSELELRATEIGVGDPRAPGATRLRPERIRELLGELHRLGEIMALTRNRWAVHEKIGVWEPLTITGEFGLVLDDPIDLRLFLGQWAHAIAVVETIEHGPGKGELRHSLHFFDAGGDAIHKVYVREPGAAQAFLALLERHRADDQSSQQLVTARVPEQPAEDDAIDVEGFRTAWLGLRDTHEFFPMLRRFKVARTQALRLAPTDHATPVALDSIVRVLERASATGLEIMVFVGNRGCLQIHTGPVHQVVALGPWINVMDLGFNLHLRTDGIAQAWVVRKPTDDGDVTSLELFDADGQTIALLFGARKPGKPELPEWRQLLGEVLQSA
jgi:putative hemin transport protein